MWSGLPAFAVDPYAVAFWDSEKTALEGQGPFLIMKIFKPNFSSCVNTDYKYIIWLTLEEENISK